MILCSRTHLRTTGHRTREFLGTRVESFQNRGRSIATQSTVLRTALVELEVGLAAISVGVVKIIASHCSSTNPSDTVSADVMLD